MLWKLTADKAPTRIRRFSVLNETRGNILADFADVADDSATRRKGLLGRETLPVGQGLWIVPCQGVHSWAMRFCIDVLYLDRKKRVRKLRTRMQPWRLSFCLTAHSVLELPAGTVERTGTKPGDRLSFEIEDERDTSVSCQIVSLSPL